MSRFPRYTTFSEAERLRLGLPARIETESISPLLRSLTVAVTLPDGKPCSVTYTRDNSRSHKFAYTAPVCRSLWVNARLAGGEPAIQAKAQELAIQAFRQAQQEEQKEMRRKTPPPGRRSPLPPADQRMKVRHADACAGLYAVCVRFTTGYLLPLGRLHEQPEAAQAELAGEEYQHKTLYGGQRLVIGIANRWARCWVEPEFLAAWSQPSSTAEEPDDAEESVSYDGCEEENY